MGPLPNYFGYYVSSCKRNKTVDYVVINDTIQSSYQDENIQFLKMNLEEFNSFASNILKQGIHLNSAWKINEIKPLFGNIFKDLLTSYDFWGWCDLDIIWGEIRSFLTDDLLNHYDVVTTKVNWSAGHFTLFKNTDLCNNLYTRNKTVISLLNDPVYYAFEESCHRWNGEIFSFEDLEQRKLPVSMFDIIKKAELSGELHVHFKDIIREHPQAINYSYKNGRLTDLDNGEEFMYYHLITVKKIWRYYIPPFHKSYDSLKIIAYGIKPDNQNSLLWVINRALSCARGILKSVRKQPLKQVLKKLIGIRSEN